MMKYLAAAVLLLLCVIACSNAADDACIPLNSSQYSDLVNDTLVYQGGTLHVIGYDPEGRPVVCAVTTPQLQHRYPSIAYIPAIAFPSASIVLNIATIATYHAALCSLRHFLSIVDVAALNYLAALIPLNFFLLLEGTVMQAAPSVIFCKHIAYFLHYFYLYQTVALSCLGVQLIGTTLRVDKRKERSSTAATVGQPLPNPVYSLRQIRMRIAAGAVCIMVSVVGPALVVAPTAIASGIDAELIRYGVTVRNTLECWINDGGHGSQQHPSQYVGSDWPLGGSGGGATGGPQQEGQDDLLGTTATFYSILPLVEISCM